MHIVTAKNNGPSKTGSYVILDTTRRTPAGPFTWAVVSEHATYGPAWEEAQRIDRAAMPVMPAIMRVLAGLPLEVAGKEAS